jgi:hypothetical protein
VPLLALGSGFQRELTGRENVYLNAAMYGIPTPEVARQFDEIVDFAGLAADIDRPVKEYSGGMYLRLAFSVAINMNPEILLADEVLAVGDLEFQERCLTRVAEVGRQGITVLFVSHDMAAISRLCTRGLMLHDGELIKDGTTEEVVELYQQAAWTRGGKRRRTSGRIDWGELLFVRLTSPDGQQLPGLRRDDSATIAYGFRIDKPGVLIRPVLDVFARGVLVFRASAEEETRVEDPGTYGARVGIPSGLLSETFYGIAATIEMRLPNGDHRILTDQNALSFRVHDASGRKSVNVPGVVAPRLEWHVARRLEAEVNV